MSQLDDELAAWRELEAARYAFSQVTPFDPKEARRAAEERFHAASDAVQPYRSVIRRAEREKAAVCTKGTQ